MDFVSHFSLQVLFLAELTIELPQIDVYAIREKPSQCLLKNRRQRLLLTLYPCSHFSFLSHSIQLHSFQSREIVQIVFRILYELLRADSYEDYSQTSSMLVSHHLFPAESQELDPTTMNPKYRKYTAFVILFSKFRE